MQRHQLYIALGIVDKFFNTSSPETADKILDPAEHLKLCDDAVRELKSVFPRLFGILAETLDPISVTPVSDADNDFAGYRFLYIGDGTSFDETLEFDFGSEGIDVI